MGRLHTPLRVQYPALTMLRVEFGAWPEPATKVQATWDVDGEEHSDHAEFRGYTLGAVADWVAARVPSPHAADAAGMLRGCIEDIDRDLGADLGDCAYYQRCRGVEGYEDGTCSFGCRDEPECVTCEPSDGWPSQHPDYDPDEARAAALVEQILANCTVIADLGMGRDPQPLGDYDERS